MRERRVYQWRRRNAYAHIALRVYVQGIYACESARTNGSTYARVRRRRANVSRNPVGGPSLGQMPAELRARRGAFKNGSEER